MIDPAPIQRRRLLPDVLSTSDLPEPELRAALLDGELFALGGGYLPTDMPESALRRATAIAYLVGEGSPSYCVVGLSAAWVHGLLAYPPEIHTLVVPRRFGLPRRVRPGIRIRREDVHPPDRECLGALRVTTIGRTRADVGRLLGSRLRAPAADH